MPPSKVRAIFRRNTAVLIVCVVLCGAGFGQESTLVGLHFHSDASPLEAPLAAKSSAPVEQTRHRFWDKTNGILFGAVALASAADFEATRNNLQHGGRELNPLTRQFGRTNAGLAVNFVGETVCVVGLSYLFHRTGHHRLERLTSAVDATTSSAAVAYDLTHR